MLAALAASPIVAGASARSRILFSSGRSIVSISPSGGHERVLYHARSPATVGSPSASKSGRRIAFLYRVNSNSGGPGPPRTVHKLFVARRNGSHRRLVRKFINLDVQSLQISPTGRRLVFSKQGRVSSSTQHVYTIRVDGHGLRRVSTSGADATDPQFSPSGRRVIFTKDGGSGRKGIAKVKLAGGSGHLIFRSSSASEPSYSPSGRQIAFVNAGGAALYHAWVMRSNGRRAHSLVHNASQQFNPDFSPGGGSLVYEEEHLPVVSFTLRTLRRDGSHRRVVNDGGNEPVWVR